MKTLVAVAIVITLALAFIGPALMGAMEIASSVRFGDC